MWGAESITAIANVFTAGAAVAMACFAYRGVKTWKDQITFRRKADLSEQLLQGFYQAQEVLRYARVWVQWPGEGEQREAEDPEPEELKKILDGFFVPVERLYKKSEFFSEFFALQWRAKAIIGDEIFIKFQFIMKKHREIESAAYGLMRVYREGYYSEKILENQEKFISKMKKRLGQDIDGTEQFDEEIAQCISDVEKICRKFVS